MRLFTMIFGAYHLTVRLPALIGAALYFSASWRIATSLTERAWVQWVLLACFCFNPLLFDYLVAARGYSLALGFFAWLLAIPVWLYLRHPEASSPSIERACALCSLCAGLAITANFSFGLACVSTMLTVLAWACSAVTGIRQCLRVAAWCAAPASAVLLFLGSSVLLHANLAEYLGQDSLIAAFRGLLQLSLYQVNVELVDPLIRPAIIALGPLALKAIALFGITHALLPLWQRRRPSAFGVDRRLVVAAAAAAVFTLTASLHVVARHLLHVPLPEDRSALFFVPLALLSVGALAAAAIPGRIAHFTGTGLAASLGLLAVYSLFCLRLTYFQLWIWDADTRQAYDVAAWYNHHYGIREIPSSWHFVSSLNFYRAIGHESLAKFIIRDTYPTDRPVYILILPFDQPFLDSQHLKIVYHGETSGLVVAIRPGLGADASPYVNPMTNR